MKKPIVLIQKSDKEYSYRRFIGKNMTNHIISDRMLFKHEVEMLRVNPSLLLGDNSPEPSAA